MRRKTTTLSSNRQTRGGNPAPYLNPKTHRTMKEYKDDKWVVVYPMEMVLTEEEMKEAYTERCQCHHNSSINAMLFDCEYVEGYANEVEIPHAVNKRGDTYFDCTDRDHKIPFVMKVKREYPWREIQAIHSAAGKSFLTIER